MANQPNNEPDVFLSNKNYPDAKGLFFDGFQTLEQIKDSCLVILDTNALLVPYGISKNGLSQIRSTYKPLVAANRLVIPGQVAREFAKNRPIKIAEIFQAISRKQNALTLEKGRYPLLEDAQSYQKLRGLEDQISTLITSYRASIGELLDYIRSWNWNDPVSKLYCELFGETILDPSIDEVDIQNRLTYMNVNKVPPGYKDGAKPDQGIGDLLVWRAAVQAAQERKLPVVIVSGDSKADWFYRSEGQLLFPRFELVDEIRRVSGGKSLHIVSFSRFLELFGATAEAVGEAKTEEIKIDLSTMSLFARNSVLAHLAEQSVADWLVEHYPHLDVSRDDRTGSYSLSERGGATILVSVKYFSSSRSISMLYPRIREALDRFDQRYPNQGYDNILVFLVFETEETANDAAQRLPEILARVGRSDSSVVIAHLPTGGPLRVHDPLKALPVFE